MMGKPIRIGVIGCGDISATRHLPTIQSHPGAILAALCDADKDRVEGLARQYNVSFWTDQYEDVLNNEEVDAVVVATPPWVTPKITMDALRSGKGVLCEKPMAVDLETAHEVMRVEKETGKKVQIGFTYRHGPLMDTLKQWIQEGRLGTPLIYRIGVFDETWNPNGNPAHYQRIFHTMEHGSPSVHDGAHVADFLHFFTESTVAKVESFGMKSRAEFPSSNYDISVVWFENGDLAKVEIGWFFPKFPQGQFEIIGPKGIAVFDSPGQTITLQAGAISEQMVLEEDWVTSCFRMQLDKFIDCIIHDRPCNPGTTEGINSLRLTKRMEPSGK
jgi:myo-inositol 2-dehydrogenase/D-chiro-inositol 1-dehydrogenase